MGLFGDDPLNNPDSRLRAGIPRQRESRLIERTREAIDLPELEMDEVYRDITSESDNEE